MCHGYYGYSDRQWELASERRRLEAEKVERARDQQRRETVRAAQDEELARLERALTRAEHGVAARLAARETADRR